MSEIKVNKISPRTACGTVTLGDSGDTIALGAGASQTGFGRTGTVDWQTGSIKTTTFTAVDGQGFFADTSSGGFTMNLPAGTAGSIVSVVDYTNTFQTGNLTVAPNGSQKIGGVASSFTANTEGQSLTWIYVDDTEGWKNIQDSTSNATGSPFINASGGTETTCGNDKIHTFTGPGTFAVSKVADCAANNVVSYLVVGGGGGGGIGDVSGGGGAGGYRELKSPSTPSFTASPLDGYPNAPNRITVTATSFPIAVGGGGAAGATTPPGSNGTNGVNSTFSTITGAGGGGGSRGCASPPTSGSSGGSGGGAAYVNSTVGSGNTPPTTPAQGNNGGGNANPSGAPAYGAGGGGGAGAVGGDGSPSAGGAGGAGVASSISGSSVTRSGGGGGARNDSAQGGAGGSGGGGAGGGSGVAAGNGTDNTGGGGGGKDNGTPSGGTGGSGIVIIRYKFQ